MKESGAEYGLITLIQKGGIYPDIPGSNPLEVLTHMISTIRLAPAIKQKDLLKAVLEREALMSTAMGNGIALPHPRNPIISCPEEQCVIIGFLRQSVDWKALDGIGVHTLLLIVSASAKLHLHTLSEITFLCQQASFRTYLKDRAPLDQIISSIRAIEQTWH
ncbi:MAG: PTS sugar transporter subunit IIA [Treponema sp.]|nr:PTS sugar transporter subunit IIA [Treponema sp.]